MPHHAYYIEGPLSNFEAYKERLSPLYAQRYEKFGIEEARALIGQASLKNYQTSSFLLGIGSITSEAQQALLKLFEEPQEGTQFVLMVPHGVLMATLRSRMLEYPDLLEAGGDSGSAKKFLTLSGKERTDFIAKLLKEEDKERVRDFVNALEAEVYKKARGPKGRAALADLTMVRDYLRDRSPSLKMLLEHLAISLPSL